MSDSFVFRNATGHEWSNSGVSSSIASVCTTPSLSPDADKMFAKSIINIKSCDLDNTSTSSDDDVMEEPPNITDTNPNNTFAMFEPRILTPSLDPRLCAASSLDTLVSNPIDVEWDVPPPPLVPESILDPFSVQPPVTKPPLINNAKTDADLHNIGELPQPPPLHKTVTLGGELNDPVNVPQLEPVPVGGTTMWDILTESSMSDELSRKCVLGTQLLQLVSATRQRTYFAMQSVIPNVRHTLKLQLAENATTTRLVPATEIQAFLTTAAGRTGLNLRANAKIVVCEEKSLGTNNSHIIMSFVGNTYAFVVGVEQDFEHKHAHSCGGGRLRPALYRFERPFITLDLKICFHNSCPCVRVLHGVNFYNEDSPNQLVSVHHVGHGVVEFDVISNSYNAATVWRCEHHTGPLPGIFEKFTFIRPLVRPPAQSTTPNDSTTKNDTYVQPVVTNDAAVDPLPDIDLLFVQFKPVVGAVAQLAAVAKRAFSNCINTQSFACCMPYTP
jgi:hypothetical protein